jgi:DNA invertase Pin-like site-specific DNA recombinase
MEKNLEKLPHLPKSANKQPTKVDAIIWSLAKVSSNGKISDDDKETCLSYAKEKGWKTYSRGGIYALICGIEGNFEGIIDEIKAGDTISNKVLCADFLTFGANKMQAADAIQKLYDMGVTVIFINDGIEITTQKDVDATIRKIFKSRKPHLGLNYETPQYRKLNLNYCI